MIVCLDSKRIKKEGHVERTGLFEILEPIDFCKTLDLSFFIKNYCTHTIHMYYLPENMSMQILIPGFFDLLGAAFNIYTPAPSKGCRP